MMVNIAKFFIVNYKFTFVMSIFALFFGISGLIRTNAESYPNVDFAMATIDTYYSGASSDDIETRITKPIEEEIRKVNGVKDVQSTSRPGHSNIFVRGELDSVDVKEMMGDLQRAVDRVSDLPADLRERPTFREIKSEEFPVIELAIVGPNDSRQRDVLADLMQENLEDNAQVLGVRKSGYLERAFQVRVDPEKLNRYQISFNQLERKLNSRNKNTPAGTLDGAGSQKILRIEGKVADTTELENTIIRANYSGNIIRLKDVAVVEDSFIEPKTITHYNGEEATLLIITKKGGADTIAMVRDLTDRMEQFKNQYDDQFDFYVYSNESIKVKDKLEILSSNAVTGLILVILFLLIFLPGKIGLVASLSLPICILITLGVMPLFDLNLNSVTILALVIALGMLVDNSVVISENYARLVEEGFGNFDAAMKSIRQLWIPISATVFTTMAAFLPMLVTQGIMGKFIRSIPIIVCAALLASLIESFLLLPMRLNRLNLKKKNKTEQKTGWFQKVAAKFESLVAYCIRYRYLSALVFTGLLILSILMIGVFNKLLLFPSDQSEAFEARIELDKGTTLPESDEVVKKIASAIRASSPEHITHIVSRAGTSQSGPADPKGKDGDNVGMISIFVDDYFKYEVTNQEILALLQNSVKEIGVGEIEFEARRNGPPVGDPVNVTLRSNNAQNLAEATSRIMADLQNTEGVFDVNVNDVFTSDEVYIDLDYSKIARLNLDPESIGRTVRQAFSGQIVSTLNLDNKDVDILVRFDPTRRQRSEDLYEVRFEDNRGNLVPLGEIATLREKVGDPIIKRFDFKRSKTITAKIDGQKITSIAANAVVSNSFNEMKEEFSDLSLTYGGEGENTKESLESLFNALIISLIGIFALLVLLFNSFLKPFIIMTTIPLGLVGFSIAFYLHQRPISFLALIGIIGLGGIIVNAGIILISFIDELKQDGMELFEALKYASRLRLRAVIVSSLTTISGLLPTAYGIGGSDDFLMPMTLAMAWGLTSGTILTLIWVPCAYAISEDLIRFLKLDTSKADSEIYTESDADIPLDEAS